jgi:hypothetical protein
MDLQVYRPPDLVVEIEMTNPLMPKLPLLAEAGVPEVWTYDGHKMSILLLNDRLPPSNRSSCKITAGRGFAGTRRDSLTGTKRYTVLMANKRKATFYIDEDVLRVARVDAARHDRRDSDVVEEALRKLLGFGLIEEIWARSDLDEDEAMQMAVEETRAVRKARHASRHT